MKTTAAAAILAALAFAFLWQWIHADHEAERLRNALAGACDATRTLAPAAWVTTPQSNDPYGLAVSQLKAACIATD